MSECANCKNFYYQGMCKAATGDDFEKMDKPCPDYVLKVESVIRCGAIEICPHCKNKLDHLYTGMRTAYCKNCGGKFIR